MIPLFSHMFTVFQMYSVLNIGCFLVFRFSCFGAVPSNEGSAMPIATLVAFVAMKSFSRGTWLSWIARPGPGRQI